MTYRVDLVPVDSKRWESVPGSVRLRRALKAMLRGYGLRAVDVTATRHDRPPLMPEPDNRRRESTGKVE